MNSVNLVGRLATDVELKYTQAGKAVCSFRIAIDRGYGDNKQTDFLPVTVWEQQAEFAANHLAKGRLVSVEGRLQSRQYETQAGEKRTAYDVVAHRLQGLGPKPNGEREDRQQTAQRPAPQTSPAEYDPHDPFEDQ